MSTLLKPQYVNESIISLWISQIWANQDDVYTSDALMSSDD